MQAGIKFGERDPSFLFSYICIYLFVSLLTSSNVTEMDIEPTENIDL